MFTKDFVACVPVHFYFFFLTAAHFHHSLPLLFLITRSSSFSVIHVSVGIKNNIEKDVFFSLNVQVPLICKP